MHDPEGVHQLRVALRRMRATLAQLASETGSTEAEALAAEAKWLASEMGDARDLDVLLSHTIAETAEAIPDAAPYDLLASELEPLRTAAHGRAAEALASPRASRFMLQLGLHARTRDWGEASTEPVVKFARRTLSKLHRKALKTRQGLLKAPARRAPQGPHRLEEAALRRRTLAADAGRLGRPRQVSEDALGPAGRFRQGQRRCADEGASGAAAAGRRFRRLQPRHRR